MAESRRSASNVLKEDATWLPHPERRRALPAARWCRFLPPSNATPQQILAPYLGLAPESLSRLKRTLRGPSTKGT